MWRLLPLLLLPAVPGLIRAAPALETKAIGAVELHGSLGGLKEVIEQNRSVDQMPELSCFGLLEAFDMKPLAALVAPRPVQVAGTSERTKVELAELKGWYHRLGQDFEPLR